MKKRTFKNGIYPPHNKISRGDALVECSAPDSVCISLSQHIGKPARAVVGVGDAVKAGTLIGAADGFVSANVFSSVSGVVKAIENKRTPVGVSLHIVIQNDARYEETRLPHMTSFDKTALLERVKDAGIVGMGGAGFPTHVKYSPKNPVDTFIINAAECEPYITCDNRIILEHTKSFLQGAAYLARILGLDSFYIGIEDNKPNAVELINEVCLKDGINARVVVLKSKYPQGAEKQLIYAVTGRKVPLGGLPADVGVVVGNVHTAYAVYDAVVNDVPLYRRAVTVTGDVERPCNLWVRTGVPYSTLADFAGVKSDCVKTVSGGPMMGFALSGTDYYITKTSGSVLFLNADEANTATPAPCINCSRCQKACPMNLMPMYIDAYTLIGDYKTAKKYGAANCIECGCCSYSCPSKRPIVQSVKLCKKKLKELGL